MDHTHKLSGSSIVDICIIQVSYMNGSGLMLIDTCITHTYIRVKYHRIIRQSVTKFQLYHRYIYVSRTYAFCIPASKILHSCILLLESPCPLVGWFVRWFVGNKKTRIIDTRIKFTDHRYMHLSYPHHTHMQHSQGLNITDVCIMHICIMIKEHMYMHRAYMHHVYMQT